MINKTRGEREPAKRKQLMRICWAFENFLMDKGIFK